MFSVHFGEDDYTAYAEAKKAAQKLVDQVGKELVVLDGDDTSVADLVEKVQSIGLFVSGNIVLAKRLFDNAKAVSYLEANLDKVLSWDLVVWQPGKLDKRKKIVKQLIDKKRAKEYPVDKPWQVEEWLHRQLEHSLGERVPKAYVQELIERIGLDKFALNQEVEKLSLYFAATKRLPELSELLAEGEGDIWKFLDLLTAGKTGEAIAQFDKLISAEESDQYLIAMLARELQLLTDIHQARQHGRNPSSLGLHPFVLEKTQKKAQRFSLEKLKKLTQALLRLDLGIKRGELEPKTALTLYLLSWQ